MKHFDVSQVTSKAWEVFKENWLMLIAIVIVCAIIENIIRSMLAPDVTIVTNFGQEFQHMSQMERLKYIADNVQAQPGQGVAALVSKVIEFGTTILMIGLVKGKIQDFTFDCWKQNFMSYVHFLLAEFVAAIIIGIGFVCCILPGFWLLSRLCFAGTAVANNPKLTFMEGLSKSWAMTAGNSMNIIFLFIVSLIICIAGFVCCCVGVIPAGIVCELAFIVAFLTLNDEPEETTETEAPAGPQTL